MYSRIVALILTVSCVTAGICDVTVREWNGISDTKFRVIEDPADPNVVQIIIVESDPEIFKFEAFYTGTNNPADIDRIETDPLGVTGTVRVMIKPDPQSSHVFGAASIGSIDLSTADIGELMALKISGALATQYPVVVRTISGELNIPGGVHNDITTEWLTGDIVCASLENLWVITPTIPIQGGHTGSVTVSGGYDATMSFHDLMAGTIAVGGTMSGTIEGTGDMANITVATQQNVNNSNCRFDSFPQSRRVHAMRGGSH
jgi:hypothetical protein